MRTPLPLALPVVLLAVVAGCSSRADEPRPVAVPPAPVPGDGLSVPPPAGPQLTQEQQDRVVTEAQRVPEHARRATCVSLVTTTAVRYALRSEDRAGTLETARQSLGERNETYAALLAVTSDPQLLLAARNGGVTGAARTAAELAAGACPQS